MDLLSPRIYVFLHFYQKGTNSPPQSFASLRPRTLWRCLFPHNPTEVFVKYLFYLHKSKRWDTIVGYIFCVDNPAQKQKHSFPCWETYSDFTVFSTGFPIQGIFSIALERKGKMGINPFWILESRHWANCLTDII